MLETCTIRCRCGHSLRMTGAMVDRPRCPHCGNLPPREELAEIDRVIAIARDPSRCNHAGASRARLFRVLFCCACSRPVLPLMPSPEDLIMASAAIHHLNTISVDRVNGVDVWMHRFPDGRRLYAFPLLSPSIDDSEPRGCIQVGRDDPVERDYIEDVWEFPRWSKALEVFVAWDGRGEPPGWDRHPRTKRYRRNGIAPPGTDDPRRDSAPCESQGG